MKESPLYSRTYDLMLWLLPQTTKFPRVHRFGLGERITRRALDFQETLISAGKQGGTTRLDLLLKADTQLAQLRQLLRMSVDLQIMSLGQYEHVTRMVNEVGRLLGTWLRNIRTQG